MIWGICFFDENPVGSGDITPVLAKTLGITLWGDEMMKSWRTVLSRDPSPMKRAHRTNAL